MTQVTTQQLGERKQYFPRPGLQVYDYILYTRMLDTTSNPLVIKTKELLK
jgi:hypothetical protein